MLFEWARREKTALGLDFLPLARHLQLKEKHVWPRKTLGEPPIAKDPRTFKKKLEKHLGGSQRTNIATHRLRAETLLIKHLAWMPSTMPPPSVPMTQFFGGQTQCVNSGTYTAMQRKGHAKPKPRAAAPKPSPPPPPFGNGTRSSPAGATRTQPNGTPTTAEGGTRPPGAPPVRPSPLGLIRFQTDAEAKEHLEAGKMMATMQRAPVAPEAEPTPQPAKRKAPKDQRRKPRKSEAPRRLTAEQEQSIPVGLHKTGRGWGQLPLQTMLGCRHLVGACGTSLVKLPASLSAMHVMMHHTALPEQALIGRKYATNCILKLNQYDTAVAAARFQVNFKQSGGRLGGNAAHDGSDRPDAKLGSKAHVMQYQWDYWDLTFERANSYLLGARVAASRTSVGTARQLCDRLHKWDIVNVADNRAASFAVSAKPEQRGMVRSCNSDNATAAENVQKDMETFLGYGVSQWGCFQHRVQILGTNGLQAFTGLFNDTFECSVSVNALMSKLKWVTEVDYEKNQVNWELDKLEPTHFVRMKAPMLGKWEYVSDPLHKIDLYLSDWRTFARNQAHRMVGAGQETKKEMYELISHCLHSAQCMFDFYVMVGWMESYVAPLFQWAKAVSHICPQSGVGYRRQDVPVKVIKMKRELIDRLPKSADSDAVFERKFDECFPKAAHLVSQGRTSEGAGMQIEVGPEQRKKLMRSVGKLGDKAEEVFTKHFLPYLDMPWLMGSVTDWNLGAYAAAHVQHAVYGTPVPAATDLLTEVTESSKAEAADLRVWLQLAKSEIKALCRKEKIDSAEHRVDWAKLATRRTAREEEPDTLFNIRSLPKVFLYFAGDFFGGQSGAQTIEGGFSQWDHLTDSAQDMLLKEALMMWKYHNDRRSENKSALLRQRAGSGGTTMDTPLPNVDGSRTQVAVAHGAELLDEFALYEAAGEDPLSAAMMRRAEADKVSAKRQRRSEYEAERAQLDAARARGRTAKVFNSFAAARKEEDKYAWWAPLGPAGQVRAKAQYKHDKAAHASLGAAAKKRSMPPSNPEPKFKRHTSTQEVACPQPPGGAGAS